MWDLTREDSPDQTLLSLGVVLVHLLGQPWLLTQADQLPQSSGLFMLFRTRYLCALGIFLTLSMLSQPSHFSG